MSSDEHEDTFEVYYPLNDLKTNSLQCGVDIFK